MTRLALPTLIVVALVSVAASPTARGDSTHEALSESYRLHAAGNLNGAIRALVPLVEKHPKDYFARVRIAYLELLSADYVNAAGNYRLAAEIKPGAIEPLLGEQQSLLAMGRFSEAERVGRAAVHIDPNNYLASSRLAWTLLKQKRFDEAADQYENVLQLYPADVDMRLGYAQSLLSSGRKAEASMVFQQILDMVPGHKDATVGLAACG